MNLSKASVVLRPRTVSEVMDLACMWVGSRAFGMMLRLSAITLLPVFAVVLACRYALDWEPVALWLLALTLVTPLQGVFTIAAGRMLFAEELTVRDVLRQLGRRLSAYLGALFVSRIYMALLAWTVVGLPVIWLRMMYVHEACLLEMASGVEATKRSTRLVGGRSSGAFQSLMVLALAQIGCVVAAEFLGHGLIDGVLQLGKPFGSLWKNAFSPYALLGLLASVPYIAVARYLFYIDTRTRSDGWDIQVRFFAVAAEQDARRGLSA